jgi:hypothetical protein
MPRLADLYDGFLFDLEGILDRDTGLIPFAPETLHALGSHVFLSTNVTRSPSEVAALLAGLGVNAHRGQVVTQSQAAARLVTGLVPARSDEFVLGTTPPNRAGDEPSYPLVLREAIRRAGARYPLVVTDRLACVAAARLIQVPSVLLLTASSDLAELLAAPPMHRPTFVATDIRDLLHQQPIVDCDARYWSCDGWVATVSKGELRLYPGALTSLAAGARVLCAAAWNWAGPELEVSAALELFSSLVAAWRP